MRRRGSRYLSYSLAAALLPVAMAVAVAGVGSSHPLVTTRQVAFCLVSGLIALGCFARALRLLLGATSFESLNRSESLDLERWLCPGMLRSDIVDELSRHGWRIGKIRTVLAALTPLPR